jgi:predicted hydrocarbon binding protein
MDREAGEIGEAASRHAKSFLSFAGLSTVLLVTLVGGATVVNQIAGTALAVLLVPIWLYLNVLRLFEEVAELVDERDEETGS